MAHRQLRRVNRGRIHVSPDGDYADVLLNELEGYSSRTTASGVSIFENGSSRDSPHDDLLFATMLAVFVAPRSGPMEDCRVFTPV